MKGACAYMSKKEGRVNFIIDNELMEQGKLLAAAQGISFSELLCRLLSAYVERNQDTLAEYEEIAKQLQEKLKSY